MNINTLTIKAQEALQAALSLARERGQQAVEPLHLLAVLIREDDSLDVPAGARGSECTFAARRGRPGRGVAAARRGRRRAVLCAGHLEGDPARRGLHEEFRRQIRLRRTPAAGPRGRARAGRRHPQTQRRDGKGADRGDPHLPQGCDGRFADLRAAVRRAGQVCHQPQRAGALGKTRPGHRA